jgi:DNA-binding HxlR family transcriptional regulator
MYRKTFDGMNCSIARALDEVGEWWSLLIVRECTLGTTRFDEFQRRLGIARNVLTARLNKLVEHGVLDKVPAQGEEHRNEYRLTAKGEDLYPVLVALLQWGDRWCGHEPELEQILAISSWPPCCWPRPRGAWARRIRCSWPSAACCWRSFPGAPSLTLPPDLVLALFVAPVLLDAASTPRCATCATTGRRWSAWWWSRSA